MANETRELTEKELADIAGGCGGGGGPGYGYGGPLIKGAMWAFGKAYREGIAAYPGATYAAVAAGWGGVSRFLGWTK